MVDDNSDLGTVCSATGADLYLAGIVYNKNGELELSGGADIVANFAVGTVSMTGNTNLTVEGFTSPNWETVE